MSYVLEYSVNYVLSYIVSYVLDYIVNCVLSYMVIYVLSPSTLLTFMPHQTNGYQLYETVCTSCHAKTVTCSHTAVNARQRNTRSCLRSKVQDFNLLTI